MDVPENYNETRKVYDFFANDSRYLFINIEDLIWLVSLLM